MKASLKTLPALFAEYLLCSSTTFASSQLIVLVDNSSSFYGNGSNDPPI
jgi:hypothetical protein